MRIKKTLVVLLIISIAFLPLNIYMASEEEYSEEEKRIIENYVIEKNDDGSNTYTIVSYDSGVYTNIIPGEVDGKIITRIGDGAFKDLKQIAGQISLPDSIKYIGDEAFSGCTSMVRIEFGDDLEEIGNKCFYGCTNLNDISYNNNIKRIGDNAYENCRSLEDTYMNIPESIEYIGSNAFANTGIDLIIFNSKNAPVITENTFYRCRSLKIRVPNKSEGYIQENNWPMDKVISTLLGDADGDMNVNAVDAAIVMNKFKNNNFTNDDLYNIDMNYDKVINSVDAAIIMNRFKNNL